MASGKFDFYNSGESILHLSRGVREDDKREVKERKREEENIKTPWVLFPDRDIGTKRNSTR